MSRPSQNLHILVFVPHAVEIAVFLFAVVLHVTDDTVTDSPGIVAGLLGIELHLGGDGADLAAHALDVLLAHGFPFLSCWGKYSMVVRWCQEFIRLFLFFILGKLAAAFLGLRFQALRSRHTEILKPHRRELQNSLAMSLP